MLPYKRVVLARGHSAEVFAILPTFWEKLYAARLESWKHVKCCRILSAPCTFHVGLLHESHHFWLLRGYSGLVRSRPGASYIGPYPFSLRCRAQCTGIRLSWSPYVSLQIHRDYSTSEWRLTSDRQLWLYSACCWILPQPCSYLPDVLTLYRERQLVLTSA